MALSKEIGTQYEPGGFHFGQSSSTGARSQNKQSYQQVYIVPKKITFGW